MEDCEANGILGLEIDALLRGSLKSLKDFETDEMDGLCTRAMEVLVENQFIIPDDVEAAVSLTEETIFNIKVCFRYWLIFTVIWAHLGFFLEGGGAFTGYSGQG